MKPQPPAVNGGKRLFSAREAADRSGFSYWTIRAFAKAGKVPVAGIYHKRAPLFDEEGIEWLKERRAHERPTEAKLLFQVSDYLESLGDPKEEKDPDMKEELQKCREWVRELRKLAGGL